MCTDGPHDGGGHPARQPIGHFDVRSEVAMKGPWAALTVSLSLGTAPALAQHEAPSHEDQSSGHGGHDDSGPGSSDANVSMP